MTAAIERPEERPIALAARNIRVERGGKSILRGVDLEAKTGEVVGVLGPSGAGKSTLFRVLVGEFVGEPGGIRTGRSSEGRPGDQGIILLAGQDVTRWPLWKRARAGMGYVPQEPSVLWDLTVQGNLRAFRQIAGLPAPDDATRAAAARVGLEGRLDVRAGELSGGERRRLELARAITRSPRVLICDEPFAGVDPAGAERLGLLLREVADLGTTVLLADHHVTEALRICTRALLLLDGSVALAAQADEFIVHPLVRDRYLGTWPTAGSPRGEASAPPLPPKAPA